MQKAERELIELKFKGVYEHQTANFDIITKKLGEIHEQTLLTNGRVSKLEKQTKFFRWIEGNPKLSITLGVLIFVGFVSLGTFLGWTNILNKVL